MSIELITGMKVRVKGTNIEGIVTWSVPGICLQQSPVGMISHTPLHSLNAAGLLEEVETEYLVKVTASQARIIMKGWPADPQWYDRAENKVWSDFVIQLKQQGVEA